MPKVDLSVGKIHSNSYYVSKEKWKEKLYHDESHVPEQRPLSGVMVYASKLYNDFLTYFVKGFSGSKNSDFYEFLSLGEVPNLIGSVTLISLYNLANHKFNAKDARAAGIGGKQFGAGVVLYTVGKFLATKLPHMAIKQSTGVDLDMYCINKVNEVSENGSEKGRVRNQYSKVFASRDFYRKDLLELFSSITQGDMYAYDDKIAKKAGFKDKLSAPNRVTANKIRELISRTTALENITKYITAGLGVALGSREAFGNIKFMPPKSVANIKTTSLSILSAIKDGFKQLWTGKNVPVDAFDTIKDTDLSFLKKNAGKVAIIASVVSMALTWIIPTIGYKTNPNTIKTKIDENIETEVC